MTMTDADLFKCIAVTHQFNQTGWVDGGLATRASFTSNKGWSYLIIVAEQSTTIA